MDLGQWRAFSAAMQLGERELLYRRTGNPTFVWQAYEIARQMEVPVPSWILEHLDGIASALCTSDPPRSPTALMGAFGMARAGGPSMASRARTAERDLELLFRINDLQNYAKAHPEESDLKDLLSVQARVAEERGLSVERVQAIWQDAQRPGSARRRN